MRHVFWDWKATYNYENVSESFDCMIAEFLLSLGKGVPPQEEVMMSYGVTTLDELAEKQLAAFKKLPSLHKYFTEIEMPLVPVLWEMEHAGIFLDVEELKKVGIEIDEAVTKIEIEMKKEVGSDFNLNSSLQLGNYLADKLQEPLKKTKTGRYATNETEISQYAESVPFIHSLLEYRQLTKLRSTYVQSLVDKVDKDGRVHTSYTQVAAGTGRLSSNDPNLQNIPDNSDFGNKIKSCFKAGKGNVLVSLDYSQQELRILAHLSNEASLKEAFVKKEDVHAVTASKIFHVEYQAVTHAQRRIAKTINFGVVYGMSAFGMSSQLHIPVEEAQKFITEFNKTYPNIQEFYKGYLKSGWEQDFVETLLGRRRYVKEFKGQKFIDPASRRVLINYPIQGSAADLIKKAMITIQKEVIETGVTGFEKVDVKMLLQIHDDLVFEVKDDNKLLEAFIQKVHEIMCSIYPLSVPIEADVKIGKSWGEMVKR